ncbi:MAG: DUF3592 domain-containing protein [Chloroflexi bacterium]|nr:DUF3592 domain-containing protein [Chloroflexota bacterium]
MSDFGFLFSGATALITVGAFTCVLVPLIGFFAYIIWSRQRQVSASKSWPTTTGTVLSSSVELRRSRSGRSGYSLSHYPVVVYDYEVRGQRYQGNRIGFSEIGTGWAGPAQQKIAGYPVGGAVRVFYNPQNPAEAVLEQSAPGNPFLWIIVIVLAASLIGTVCFVVAMTAGIGVLLQMVDEFVRQLPNQ